jgi:UDP-N-acetylmuramate dehydrogenase
MLKIKKDFPLKRLSTFKIGGEAKYFCEVRNDEELLGAITAAKKLRVPYKIIAGGSNVVFPDLRLNCLLIKIRSGQLRVLGNEIIADAGVLLSRVIAAANNNGLAGSETLAGIPGTLGGAIVGNAGAYGHSISEVVEKVEIFNGVKRRWFTNSECNFAYRESVFKEKPYIVLRALLKFKKGDHSKLKKISQNIIQVRLKKYKPGIRCPGSFFKNVLVSNVSRQSLWLIDRNKIIDGKIPTGYLLEEVGAKEMRYGGIMIANFHGNLFINSGGAKAKDVKNLARILKNRVKKKFGILLEEEVRYL